jgi:hypothetical protein
MGMFTAELYWYWRPHVHHAASRGVVLIFLRCHLLQRLLQQRRGGDRRRRLLYGSEKFEIMDLAPGSVSRVQSAVEDPRSQDPRSAHIPRSAMPTTLLPRSGAV